MDKKKMILIVDDEPEILKLISTFLDRKGFDTLIARNGEDALRELENCKDQIDCVITDLDMPGISGIELLKLLRGDARFRTTPVILGSARVAEFSDLRTTAEELNAHVLQKPYRFNTLIDLLETVLRKT